MTTPPNTADNDNTPPELYSTERTMKALDISRATLNRLFDRGKLTRVKLGTRTYVEVRELRQLIAASREPAKTA